MSLNVLRNVANIVTKRFAFFSERTSFHGYRELSESRRWYQKALWLLIMIGSASMLTYAIHSQVRQYLSKSTTTRVRRLSDEEPYTKFPEVYMGIDDWMWLDVKKLDALGIGYEEIQYAKGFLSRNVPIRASSNKSLEEIRRSFRSAMSRANITGISNFFRRLQLLDFGGESDMKFSAISIADGECFYLLDLSRATDRDFSRTMFVEMKFDFSTLYENAERIFEYFDGYQNQTTELSNPSLYNVDTNQGVVLEPCVKLTLTIESKLFRQLSHCRSDVDHDPLYFPHVCKIDCEIRANVSFGQSCVRSTNPNGSSSFFTTSSYRDGSARICHNGLSISGSLIGLEEPHSVDDNSAGRNEMFEECVERCLLKCDQLSTSWGIRIDAYTEHPTNRSRQDSKVSMIKIDFPNKSVLMVFDEVARYDWNDMVSDLGGLLGLWLGASMMSLFQAVHLCCWSDDAKRESVLPLSHDSRMEVERKQ